MERAAVNMFLTTAMRVFMFNCRENNVLIQKQVIFKQNIIFSTCECMSQTLTKPYMNISAFCMPTELTNELMTAVRDGEEETRGACNSLLSLGCPNRG